VIALLGLCCLAAWSALATDMLVTPLVCGALVVLSIVELIRYVERTADEFRVFLRFIAHHDYSTSSIVLDRGHSSAELQDSYRLIVGEFRRLNQQKAANSQYLEAVLDHVSVALCCFDERGMVKMSNEAARHLFAMPHLNSLQTFAAVDERLPELLAHLGSGERLLVNLSRGDDVLQLLLYATEFELVGQRYKIVSFQNIRNELDRQEIDSWQKLIRVLTHEIMNWWTRVTSMPHSARRRRSSTPTSCGALRRFTSAAARYWTSFALIAASPRFPSPYSPTPTSRICWSACARS
jgi:two-component system nitrogen regulation sensor histidine kinase NtrY